MENACYKSDGILSLGGDEPHLKECPTCRDRFARRELFFRDLTAADQTMSFVARAHQATGQGREMVARLRSATREERSREVGALLSPHPALAVCFCDESKRLLFSSPNQAEEWLRLAETIFSKIEPPSDRWGKKDHAWTEAHLRAVRGNLHMFRGEIVLAHKEFEEAKVGFESLDDEFRMALLARSLGFTWTKLGQPLKAKEVCLQSLIILTAYGSIRERFSLMNNLALVLLTLSEHRKARALFDYLCASVPSDDPNLFTIHRNAILPLLERSEWKEAQAKLESMTALLESCDSDVEKGRTLRLMGEIHILEGHAEISLMELRQALDVFAPLNMGYESAQTAALLGKAYSDLKSYDKAQAHLKRALVFFSGQRFALDLVKTLEVWNSAIERKDLSDRAFHAIRSFDRISPPPPAIPIM